MCFDKLKKMVFTVSQNLKYDWIGTIEYPRNKLYQVYGTEARINLDKNKNIPGIVIKLTSENSRDEYVIKGRENPESNYWTSLPYVILRIIENEFLPKYDGN